MRVDSRRGTFLNYSKRWSSIFCRVPSNRREKHVRTLLSAKSIAIFGAGGGKEVYRHHRSFFYHFGRSFFLWTIWHVPSLMLVNIYLFGWEIFQCLKSLDWFFFFDRSMMFWRLIWILISMFKHKNVFIPNFYV